MSQPKREACQKITVSDALIEDSKDIWEWRNDPTTKLMSITAENISWEEHKNWYENSLANPNCLFFIGYFNDTIKIGVCRFDIDTTTLTAEVSINLNPHYRNNKLSTRLLTEAIERFRTESSATLTATIKKINASSIACFVNIGFVFKSSDTEYNYYYLA